MHRERLGVVRQTSGDQKGSHGGRRAGHGQPDEARDVLNTWPHRVYSQELVR